MDMRTGLLAGAGVAMAATGIGSFLLRERSSVESLTDVVFAPHDRDSSGTIGLDGPPRADDERMFPAPGDAQSDASFLLLLRAADLLGVHDKVVTRDEVRGLMELADENDDGRLSRREQHKLTHAAYYTEDYGSFISNRLTLREVPAKNTWTRPSPPALLNPTDWYRAEFVLNDYDR